MRVLLSNIGCKLNQAELESIARQLVAAGHQIVGAAESADLHIINSCTVTHVAARDSRKVVRRAKRRNPALKTILTGCYAAGAESDGLQEIDAVIDNEGKEDLVQRLGRLFPAPQTRVQGIPDDVPFVPLEYNRTRAAVKIEDGCNMRCSFCVIPLTRGPQRSLDAEKIVGEVRELVGGGCQEVVITGVQISSYRSPLGGLYELCRKILAETDVRRLRLTSIAPWQFDSRLFDLFPSGRLCRHFHFSLQSGCDDTLRRMRRPYTGADFARLLAEVRERVPDVAVTTDLIVGFPGESDGEFATSLAFTEAMGFSRIHVFPYSARPGTEAAQLSGQVSPEKKRQRMAAALHAAHAAENRYWESHVGAPLAVLWERETGGSTRGTSDNYIQVITHSPQPIGTISNGRLESLGPDGPVFAAGGTGKGIQL